VWQFAIGTSTLYLVQGQSSRVNPVLQRKAAVVARCMHRQVQELPEGKEWLYEVKFDG
jgi:ATP-dependent DNA ligase